MERLVRKARKTLYSIKVIRWSADRGKNRDGVALLAMQNEAGESYPLSVVVF